MTPSFEEFSKVTRNVLSEVIDANEAALKAFDSKGPTFHFYYDAFADSLDMLDITFGIEKVFNIKMNIESMLHHSEDMTLQNLYSSILK